MKILRNRAVIALIAVTAAFVFAFVVVPHIGRSQAQMTEIVRITKKVDRGVQITKSDIETVTVGGYNLPARVMTNADDVIGKYTLADFAEGDYILSEKISETLGSAADKLYRLDGTQKVISVLIDSLELGISGMIMPDDIVTLYAVNRDGVVINNPFLQYVEVLTCTTNSGVNTEDRADGDGSGAAKTLTLFVNSQQAVLLAEYSKNSTIHAALVYRGNRETAEKFLAAQSAVFEDGEGQ